MIRTIEDLTEIYAARREVAEAWLSSRDDAYREYMTSHLKFVEATKEADEALGALIAAQGEPS